jgi:hypothetical protein
VIRGARRTAVVLAAMSASACMITLPGSDAGTDASSTGTQTVLEQCTAIYTELCQQAIGRCGLQGFTLDECIKNNVDTCCAAGVCNEQSKSSAAAVDACKSALDTEDCYLLSTNSTPSACQGLPQKP